MASDSAGRRSPQRPGDAHAGEIPSRAEQGPEQGEGPPEPPARERFGEVWLQRLRKDDGRALILYQQLDRDPS